MTLQVEIYLLVNKLEYTNNKRPSKPSLPNVLKPFKLLLPTDFLESCLHQLSRSRNTPDCQSLLAINSLLAKFFKSLCQDRFYCIQQVSMSCVIYDFSHMFICLLWFCHGLPKWGDCQDICNSMLGTYVTILCNWLILLTKRTLLVIGQI